MNSTRSDHEQRPTRDRSFLGFRWRSLDLLTPDGRTFLRRRGIEHPRFGGVLVHRLDAPDPGLDLHDHPWEFVTLVLRGVYVEEAVEVVPYTYRRGTWGAWLFDGEPDDDGALAADLPVGTRIAMENTLREREGGILPHERNAQRGGYRATPTERVWGAGSVHRMPYNVAHRITGVAPGTVTLVLRKPNGRRWGFFLPTGWVDWESYDYEARRPGSSASNKPEERRP